MREFLRIKDDLKIKKEPPFGKASQIMDVWIEGRPKRN